MIPIILLLIEHQVHADDSDADCSVDDKGLEEKIDLSKVPKIHSSENGSKNMETPLSEKNPSNPTSGHETPLSMGEILSSLDPGITLPSNSSEYSADRHSNKTNGSHSHVKRSNFWGRNNVSNKSIYIFFLSWCSRVGIMHCCANFSGVLNYGSLRTIIQHSDFYASFMEARKSQHSESVDSSGEEEYALFH